MRLATVDPTVFFVRSSGTLLRAVDLGLENPGPAVQADALIHLGAHRVQVELGLVPSGAQLVRVLVPDVREEVSAQFIVRAQGEVCDQRVIRWQPGRHWHVYLVPNSHHDLGYSDLPVNVLREQGYFLDRVLGFCEGTADFPEELRFHYVIEASWSLLHYLEHRHPEAVDRLVNLARAGQIEVAALLANEVTELCGPEQLVRLLYPSFGLKRRFGIPITTAELNDIPGVSWGLASALAGSGVRYLVAGFPDYFAWGYRVHSFWDEERVLPRGATGAFWWEGPDAQRVLLWHGGGFSPWTYDQALQDLPKRLDALLAQSYPAECVRFGFQGGLYDNAPPDVRVSLLARQWNEQWAYPRLVVATNRQFFEAFEREAAGQLRSLRGDLPNTDYTVGATGMALETGVNRMAHDTLLSAEKLAVWATVAGGPPYPADTLAEANQCSLLYDEHTYGMEDPIGSAQAASRAWKAELAHRAAALAEDVLSKSTNALADRVSLEGDGYHVVVFNSLAQKRSDVVRVPCVAIKPCGRPMHWQYGQDEPPVWIRGTAPGRDIVDLPLALLEKPFELVDLATGEGTPYQVVTSRDPQGASPWAADRHALGGGDVAWRRKTRDFSPDGKVLGGDPAYLAELVFVAEDVPPLGFKAYRIVPGRGATTAASSVRAEGRTLENRFYRVTFDQGSGSITSIWDRELGREWVDQQAPWALNQLVMRAAGTGEVVTPLHAHVALAQNGPVYCSVVVTGDAPGCPQRTQEIVLYDRLKRIEFHDRVLRDATPLLELVFAFPFAVERPEFRFESGGAVTEPIRDQLPGSNTDAYAVQHWVSVGDDRGGIVWSSPEAPLVALADLYPGYVSQAHHCVTPPGYGHPFLTDPAQLDRGHIYSYAMVSNFRTNFSPLQVSDALFRYAVTSYSGPLQRSTARDFGWSAATPLVPVCVLGPCTGSLPAACSFCQVGPSGVQLLALKAAEDGDGVIVRLAEVQGQDTLATVTFPWLEIAQAFLTNLMEENRQTVRYDRHCLEVPLAANGTATVRCRTSHAWPTPGAMWY